MKKLIALIVLISSTYSFGAAQDTTEKSTALDQRRKVNLKVKVPSSQTESDTDEEDPLLPKPERWQPTTAQPITTRPRLRVERKESRVENPDILAQRQQLAMDIVFSSLTR